MKRTTRHPRGPTGRPATSAVRRMALVAVTLLLLAQISSVVHLALIPHVVSSDTGKVTHPADEPAAPSSSSRRHPAKPGHRGKEKECQTFNILTQASIVPVSPSPATSATAPCDDATIPGYEEPRPCQWDLFRLSPSHSPPCLA